MTKTWLDIPGEDVSTQRVWSIIAVYFWNRTLSMPFRCRMNRVNISQTFSNDTCPMHIPTPYQNNLVLKKESRCIISLVWSDEPWQCEPPGGWKKWLIISSAPHTTRWWRSESEEWDYAPGMRPTKRCLSRFPYFRERNNRRKLKRYIIFVTNTWVVAVIDAASRRKHDTPRERVSFFFGLLFRVSRISASSSALSARA